VGCLYNVLIYPNAPSEFSTVTTDVEVYNRTRKFIIPITHVVLFFFNFISNSPRLNVDALKQFCSFSGSIIYIYLLCQITRVMYMYPQPIPWNDNTTSATFLWLEVEWAVFLGLLLSNTCFIAIRTCVHHKIQLD
jgi:hypothetical protein